MTTRVNQASVYNDFSGLASLKRDAQAQSPDALRQVAKQFESLFTRMMLKSMREASFGDSLLGSDQQNFYQGMFDDQLAVELSKGRGMGLADMLVKQLSQAGVAGQPSAASAANGATATGKQFSLTPTAAAIASKAAGDAEANVGVGFPLRAARLSAPPAASAEVPLESGGASAPDESAPPSAPTTWRPASKDEFIRDLWPAAQEAGKELGIDPRSLLAQAALESNWGRSMPRDAQGNASFNLFGIKAGASWNGKATTASTLEVENGVAVKSRERFRAYDSPLGSFRDYVALIRANPRYAEALNTGTDTHAFATALQRGGYATDPAYAQKVAAIAQNMAGAPTALKYAAALPINTVTRTL